MMHVHYDLSLVIGSVAISVLACYFAVSVEQMLFQNVEQQLKKNCINHEWFAARCGSVEYALCGHVGLPITCTVSI